MNDKMSSDFIGLYTKNGYNKNRPNIIANPLPLVLYKPQKISDSKGIASNRKVVTSERAYSDK
jgi:hypothetical protein